MTDPQEVNRYKGSVGKLALAAKERKATSGKEVALSEPRLVSESNRKWGVVDTEDTRETSRVKVGAFMIRMMQKEVGLYGAVLRRV